MAPVDALLSVLLEPALLDRLAGEYRARYPVFFALAQPDGAVVRAYPAQTAESDWGDAEARAAAIREGLRWGEPTVCAAGPGLLLWAVPLTVNARLVGALLCGGHESWLLPEEGPFPIELRQACIDLRLLAERHCLTNAALLARQRDESFRQQKRAEAIHEAKLAASPAVLEAYLREEPALLSAIRQGDRRAARGILNRVLVMLYSAGGERLDLVKSLAMELVVTMHRAAVECGGSPERLLGARYARLTELASIDGEEGLSRWLVEMLEGLMDSLEQPGAVASPVLGAALRVIQERCAEDLSRDAVAREVHLSPSHFSRFIKQRMGRSFTELLNQARVDRACDLLRRTDRSVLEIALDCGFADQSYFTKVFRRHLKQTPGQYRQLGRRSAP